MTCANCRPGNAERTPNPYWVTDQRYVMQLFGNGLVYHSAPFAAETEIKELQRRRRC